MYLCEMFLKKIIRTQIANKKDTVIHEKRQQTSKLFGITLYKYEHEFSLTYNSEEPKLGFNK